jgi:hypothetical protein
VCAGVWLGFYRIVDRKPWIAPLGLFATVNVDSVDFAAPRNLGIFSDVFFYLGV